MQILLNHGEVGQAVVDLINARVLVNDNEVVHVVLTEDGATVSILPEGVSPADSEGEESSGSEPQQSGETSGRKRPRRSKAQIEADNKAEAERLAQAQESAASGNDASSTVKPDAEAPVVETEAAGETTQEASDHGEAEVDPSEPAESAVVVETEVEEEQAAAEPEPVVETKAEVAEAEAPAVKPAGVSLFQNLRRPNNG